MSYHRICFHVSSSFCLCSMLIVYNPWENQRMNTFWNLIPSSWRLIACQRHQNGTILWVRGIGKSCHHKSVNNFVDLIFQLKVGFYVLILNWNSWSPLMCPHGMPSYEALHNFHDELSQYFILHPCDEHKIYVWVLLCALWEFMPPSFVCMCSWSLFSPINCLIFNIHQWKEIAIDNCINFDCSINFIKFMYASNIYYELGICFCLSSAQFSFH